MVTIEDSIYLHSLFDYVDGNLYWKVARSNCVKIGQRAGRKAGSNGYLSVRVDRKSYTIHRLIFLMHHSYVPQYLDHIDGDRSNNRIENLRPATKIENNRNMKKSKRNTSGYKGVSWDALHGKWRAQIYTEGKQKYLGLFGSAEEAQQVVQEVRKVLHSNFCNHG